MNKEIGNRIARFFYLNLKKWDEIRFEGVFLLRDTFRFKRDVCVIFMQQSFEHLHKNLMQI